MTTQTKRAQPALRVRPRQCNACMSCQVYCATANEGICSPSSSRIRVALDPWEAKHRITVCRQCKEGFCAQACPEDAIQLSADGSYWAIDYERCNGCQECVDACPVHAISVDPVSERVIKCDTCQGFPVCAQICPMGALSLRAS